MLSLFFFCSFFFGSLIVSVCCISTRCIHAHELVHELYVEHVVIELMRLQANWVNAHAPC
jgi:hypothetical protein